MGRTLRGAAFAVLAAVLLGCSPAPREEDHSAWVEPDPDNILVIETTKGRLIVELSPHIAPHHVERVKVLTRQGFYDGLAFFRVAENFMAQTGDPENTGLGRSSLPDLPPEFEFRRSNETPFVRVQSAQEG